MVIVQNLVRSLPERYIAEPRVHLGSRAEVDVATFDQQGGNAGPPRDEGAGEATSTAWSPAAPSLVVETELADVDEYEVRVFDAEYGMRLVAAIEIISPANKDRPDHRTQFVNKCAALLRQRASVVLVDVVTVPQFNLYSELLEWIGEQDPAIGDNPTPTYAASCRWRPHGGSSHLLEAWNRSLSVGASLPTLPLWLSDDLAIPLDLEASYEQTCQDLRIA